MLQTRIEVGGQRSAYFFFQTNINNYHPHPQSMSLWFPENFTTPDTNGYRLIQSLRSTLQESKSVVR
jgi:hypothetical protein